MHPLSKPLITVFVLLLITLSTAAQHYPASKKKLPRWLPENGNWMVETNNNTPLHSVIYFYTSEGIVIYKETVDGIRLDLTKKKVKMRLKKVLQEAMIAWNKNKMMIEEEEWVVSLFR